MASLFVEVYPYHFETLYPYYQHHGGPQSVVLHHPAAVGKQLFDAIDCEKHVFSLRRLVKEIRRKKIKSVHVNSVGMKLRLSRLAQIRFFFQLLLLPYLCKLLSCRVSGIVHEADQFYDTDLVVHQRNLLFKRMLGWIYIRSFDQIFVLSREVQNYLAQRGTTVDVLDTKPLSKLATLQRKKQKNKYRKTFCWIGPVDQHRRNWKLLLDIDPALMKSLDIGIDLICDIRSGQGSEFLDAISDLGLKHHFNVRHYRPDDLELLAAAYQSDAVLCLYSNPVYGRIKVSGSRHIADAFAKPVISWGKTFHVISSSGECLLQDSDINACLAQLGS